MKSVARRTKFDIFETNSLRCVLAPSASNMGCTLSKPAVQGNKNSAVAVASQGSAGKEAPVKEKGAKGKKAGEKTKMPAYSEMRLCEEEPELPLHKILPFAELTAKEVEALVMVNKSRIDEYSDDESEEGNQPMKRERSWPKITTMEDCMTTCAFYVPMEGNGEGQNPMPDRLRKRMLTEKRRSKSLWIKAQEQQVASANREEHLRQRREKARRSQLGRKKVVERQGFLADRGFGDGTLPPLPSSSGKDYEAENPSFTPLRRPKFK